MFGLYNKTNLMTVGLKVRQKCFSHIFLMFCLFSEVVIERSDQFQSIREFFSNR